jgi:hypothetical protein
MKLYVGNFSFDITERSLRELFEPFGTVSEVKLITDRETGQSRGLGQGPIRFNGKMNLDARLLVNLKLQRQLRGVLGKNLVDSEDPEYRQIPFSVTAGSTTRKPTCLTS